jgi:hypothetical protein
MSYQTQTNERASNDDQTNDDGIQTIIVPSTLLESEPWTFEAMQDAMNRRLPSGRRNRDYTTQPTFEIPEGVRLEAILQPLGTKWQVVDDSYGSETVVEIDGRYDLTATRAHHETNGDALQAWLRREFPVHTMDKNGRARLRASTASAEQFADGSGEFRTGGEEPLLAVRTRSGLVLRNSENSGSSWYSVRENDELPLSSIAQLLSESQFSRTKELRKITRLHHGTQQELRVLELEDGTGAAVARDPTMRSMYQHRNYGGGWRAGDIPTGWFGFLLTAEEMASFRTADDALDLLTPEPVAERLATGNYRLVEGAPSQYQVDPPKFGFSRRQDSIIRQGEWFFIPTEPDFEPEAPVLKPLSRKIETRSLCYLPNFERDVRVTSFPRKSFGSEGVRPVEIDGNLMMEDVESGVYYTDQELLPFGFHNPMGSHVARDLAVVGESTENYERLFVRGTVRHTEGDHDVYNFRENWFEAVRHDREVLSFTYTSVPRGD